MIFAMQLAMACWAKTSMYIQEVFTKKNPTLLARHAAPCLGQPNHFSQVSQDMDE